MTELAHTFRFVAYFMMRVELLRSHGVEPVIVFDGGRLPIKGEEEASRHRWVPHHDCSSS
jgi:exonuclease-1